MAEKSKTTKVFFSLFPLFCQSNDIIKRWKYSECMRSARRSLQWHNTCRPTALLNLISSTVKHNTMTPDDDDGGGGTMEKLSLLFAIDACFRRKMSQCELYRVIARRNRRISISSFSQKLPTEKCPATIDAVAVGSGESHRIIQFSLLSVVEHRRDVGASDNFSTLFAITCEHARLLQNRFFDSWPFGIN